MSDQGTPGTCAGGKEQGATCIADLVTQGRADVTGVIRSAHPMSISGVPACRYVLTDGTGELDLMFLGRVQIAGIEPGRRCRAVGRVSERDDRLVLWNPRYWLAPAGPECRDVLVADDDEDVLTALALAKIR
jgi:hypothetical protein